LRIVGWRSCCLRFLWCLSRCLFTNTDENIIAENTINTDGTGANYGILLLTGTDNNTIDDNKINTDGSLNANRGIFIVTGADNKVTNNVITTDGTNSNTGITLQTTVTNTTITDNEINTTGSADSNYAIQLFSTAHFNKVFNNTLRPNGTTFNQGVRLSTTTENNTISDNTIITNGTSSNYGIFLGSAAKNTIQNNTITTESKGEGILFTSSSLSNVFLNNILFNTTIGVNITSGSETNNFTGTTIENATTGFLINANDTKILNATFTTVSTAIQLRNALNTTINETIIPPPFIIQNTSSDTLNFTETLTLYNNTLLQDSISISNNSIFVNSTKEPNLNKSAEIHLKDIPGLTTPKIEVDLEDDGTFEDCSFCEVVSYVDPLLIFNTTHFTTLQGGEGSVLCGTLTQDTTMTGNLTTTGTCFTFGADDITLDCDFNTVTFDIGGTGGDGIVSSSRDNITIKNCILVDGNIGGSTGIGVDVTGSENSSIFNNTIYTNGTTNNFGIRLQTSSFNNTIENNTWTPDPRKLARNWMLVIICCRAREN